MSADFEFAMPGEKAGEDAWILADAPGGERHLPWRELCACFVPALGLAPGSGAEDARALWPLPPDLRFPEIFLILRVPLPPRRP